MIEKIMKAVKSGNKKRGRNITIGAVVGMLLSCTTVLGAKVTEHIGLEIKKNGNDMEFTANSGMDTTNTSKNEEENEYLKYNTFKDGIYTNIMEIEGSALSGSFAAYGMKISSLTDKFTLINQNIIIAKMSKTIDQSATGIEISSIPSETDFTIENNGIISAEAGTHASGIQIGTDYGKSEEKIKTTIKNNGYISANITDDNSTSGRAIGIYNGGKEFELTNHGIINGTTYGMTKKSPNWNVIGIEARGDKVNVLNTGMIYAHSNARIIQETLGLKTSTEKGNTIIDNKGSIFGTSNESTVGTFGLRTQYSFDLENDGSIYAAQKLIKIESSSTPYDRKAYAAGLGVYVTANDGTQEVLNNGLIYGTASGDSVTLNGYGICIPNSSVLSSLVNKGIIFGSKYAITHIDSYNRAGELTSGTNYGLIVSGGDKVVAENITFAGKEKSTEKNVITNYGLVFTVDEDRVYTSKDEYKNSFGTNGKLTVEGTEYNIANVGATLAEGGSGKIESYDSFKLESGDKQYDKYILNGIEKTLVVKGTGNTVSSSIINGYDEAVDMRANSGLTLKDAKVNSYGTAITMAGNSELTLENSIANGGALEESIEGSKEELPTIEINGDNNKFTLKENSIVNGNYMDKKLENISSVLEVKGNNNEVTIHGGSAVNGKMEASGDNNTLNLFGNSENMRATGTGKINVLHDISGFDDINLKGNVTFFDEMSISGIGNMTIGENSTLNIRLTNTFSGAQSDAEYDTDGKLITRPTHALENNGEKLTITGEGSDPNTTGTINFVTNNIGHRIKLKMEDIYINNLYIRASSAIDSARFEEGEELVLSAVTSLEDLHLDKIYNSDASGNPNNPKPEKPSKKRYDSLNNIYKGIYSSRAENLNALRVLIASDDLGNNYDENMSDEEQLRNLMSYLNSIYTETPYSFSSELSRRSVGMFRDIVTENEFRPNLNNWLIMGGLTHADGGTKDTYYGRNYHGFDTGTSDTSADMKLTGAYMLAKYGYSENTSLGLTLGGNKSEAKLDMSKVKGNSGYLGAFAENYRGNLTLKAGAGVQYSEYDADRRTMGGHSYSDKYSDMTYDIYLNGRYSHNIGKDLFLEPYVTLSYTYVDQNGADEGNKTLAIETDSKSFDYTVGKVGVDLKKVIPHSNGKSTLTAGVSYTKILDGADEEYITGRFKGSTTDFDILVAHKNEHSIGLNAKYTLELENGVLLDVKGTYSVERDSHNGSAKNRTKGEWIVGAGVGYKF